MPEPATFASPANAGRAQALLRYLAQPQRVAETVTSVPGECTPMAETLDEVARILEA